MLSTAFAATYFWSTKLRCEANSQRGLRGRPRCIDHCKCGRTLQDPQIVHCKMSARCFYLMFFWVFLSLSPKDTNIQTKLLHHHQKLVPGEKLVDIACLWFALVPVECTRSCLSCSDLCGKGRRKLTNEAGCAWRECCFEPTLHISSLFLAKDKAAHSSHWTPDHMRCQVQLSHHVQGTIQGDTKIIHQCWREYAGGRFSMLCTWQAGFDSCNAGTTYMMNAKASLLVDWSKRYVQ